jgi:hypothetical protein
MDLKFRLQDGDLYEFKYSKYSDFIDNLEPESGVIIDVLEPFTFEDFKTAQIEYNKYLVFKDALEDIITTRKLWSKEELKEFSKYDLDNPVLEWLMIKETREEKEIKEKLSLDTLKIEDIKSDNIILYYLVNKTNQDKFISACYYGHLEVAQWLYSLGDVNIHILNEDTFLMSCYYGHLEVAQWLYSLGGVNIHSKNEAAFRYTCCNGHLEVAQWLYSLGETNIHIKKYAFRWACENGGLEVAQWLWSLGGFHKEGIETTHQPINDWLATLE